MASVTKRIAILVFVLGTAASGNLQALFSPSASVSTFTSYSAPDFYLSASPPVAVWANGTFANSIITVSSANNFDGRVTLTYLPPRELNCLALSHPTITASGQSSLPCSSMTPGSYQVAINGTSGSLVHATIAEFAFSAIPVAVTPDITLAASTSSLSFSSGSSGSATVSVSPLNGFSGTVQFSAHSPSGVSCDFNPTRVQTSGTTTLTCNSSTAGDYAVMLTATPIVGSAHTKDITVHVAAVSPVSPASSTGLSPAILYTIIGVVIVGIVAGLLLVAGSRRREQRRTSEHRESL